MVRARLRVPEEGLGCRGIDVTEHVGVSAGDPRYLGNFAPLRIPHGLHRVDLWKEAKVCQAN